MTDKAGHTVSEPRVRYEIKLPNEQRQTRAVHVVLPSDWARVLHRQQQLLNQYADGVSLRIFRDEQGLVRIDLDD